MTAENSCATADDTVTVTVEANPDAPSLVAPADGASELQPPVALSWTAVADATDYIVQIATDAGFLSIVRNPTVAMPIADVAGLAGGTYFWRVITNTGCSSLPSSEFSFSIASGIFSDGFEAGSTASWSLTVP